MTEENVTIFITTHKEYFPIEKLPILEERLKSATDTQFKVATYTEFQKPIVSLLFSLFLGSFGVDRFIIGDIGLGVLKLLTGGCCGIMTLVDWFIIMGRTKEKNFEKIWQALL